MVECIGYFQTLLIRFLPSLSLEVYLYRQYQSDSLAFWIPFRFGQLKSAEGRRREKLRQLFSETTYLLSGGLQPPVLSQRPQLGRGDPSYSNCSH